MPVKFSKGSSAQALDFLNGKRVFCWKKWDAIGTLLGTLLGRYWDATGMLLPKRLPHLKFVVLQAWLGDTHKIHIDKAAEYPSISSAMTASPSEKKV